MASYSNQVNRRINRKGRLKTKKIETPNEEGAVRNPSKRTLEETIEAIKKNKEKLKKNTNNDKSDKPEPNKPELDKSKQLAPSIRSPNAGGERDPGGKRAKAREKAAWLKKTRRSPAAKAWGDSKEANDKRWALQEKHRKWKADKKAGKLPKKKFDPRKGRGKGWS